MAYSIFGTAGEVRFRTTRKYPRNRKGGARGPSGYKGPQRSGLTEALQSAKRTEKLYTAPKKGFLNKVTAAAKNLFRRGAK